MQEDLSHPDQPHHQQAPQVRAPDLQRSQRLVGGDSDDENYEPGAGITGMLSSAFNSVVGFFTGSSWE